MNLRYRFAILFALGVIVGAATVAEIITHDYPECVNNSTTK